MHRDVQEAQKLTLWGLLVSYVTQHNFGWFVKTQLIHLSDVFEVKHKKQKSGFYANEMM